jgi:A/G-specific adenine glycosylase
MDDSAAEKTVRLAAEMPPRLIAWYHHAKRDLPWRRTVDPYAIFVSEMMLQQTQVTTVLPYFARFMEAFPTVSALATAELEHVYRLWAGLGYYRRARNLHAAAQQMLEKNAGKVPGSLAELLALPGVGRYSGGAIASFAFGLSAPILDGNVMRVLSRLLGQAWDLAEPATQKHLWLAAERITPQIDTGTYNQAIMELGALVCTPRSPTCLLCPLNSLCAAFITGRQGEIPIKTKSKRPPVLRFDAFVLQQPDARSPLGVRALLMQRPDGVPWEGMWEFPALQTNGKSQRTEARSAAEWTGAASEWLGLDVRSSNRKPIERVSHGLTHRTMTYRVFCGEVAGTATPQLPVCEKNKPYQAYAWVDGIATLPVGRVTQKIAAAAGFAAADGPESGAARGADSKQEHAR